jgi:LPXTG-motif cell wall-anchored protein
LPYYNYFYSEEKCKGHEDFKYCKQLIDVNLTQKEFDKQFELYLKNKEKGSKTTVLDVKDNNSLVLIIGGAAVVLIITVVVILFVKRKRKNSL